MKQYLLLLLLVSFCYSQPLTERYLHLGELFIPQFSSAPFPHPLRADGRIYNKIQYPTEKHYSDSSVLIFISLQTSRL